MIKNSQARYCVFGNPIEHSLSPRIHGEFAKQCGQPLEYSKQKIELEAFKAEVKQFFLDGGKGLNITVPFKQEAWELAEVLSERAQLAGAVNTLYEDEQNRLCGDNTDGAGLVSDILLRLGWQLKNKKILMLGAGGAARGVMLPLLETQPELMVVANRTPEKAETLASIFGQYGNVQASEYQDLDEQKFDLIINATSASLNSELPPIPRTVLHSEVAVYDMVYAKTLTPFLQWCADNAVTQLADGLGMLVGQAAESFFIWRGVRPDVDNVIALLRTP